MQPNIANGGRAVAVAVKPADSTHMVVASETGGLFLTTNRGVDWQQVSGATNFGYADVAYVPGQTSTIVAAAQQDMKTVSGGGIWRSTDSGSSWNRVNLTPPTSDCSTNLGAFAVTAESGTNKLWAGTLCGVVFSTDAGATWQYLSPGTGYNNDKTYAVLAPGSNQLKILTDSGVKVSTDGGTSWSLSSTGLPSEIQMGVHDQIAVSPFNSQHLYWAFNYWSWTSNSWHLALYRSMDNGNTWSSVVDSGGINRPPITKVSAPTGANTYELYFSDGGCTLERASVTNGATPAISSWTPLTTDHCDYADIGFDNDGHTPLLLVGDAGLQFTSNGGSSWAMGGAGTHGYAALQITEVTGQLQGSGANLYFGTQDNNIWASPDDGATWPTNICCEGFFLNVWPAALAPSDTKFSGVTCSGCGNFISGPVLAGEGGFPDPPNNSGNPRLLTPGTYIQNTAITGLPGNVFDLTTNNGGSWAPRYGFSEDVLDLSKVAGDTSNPTVFTAVREPGSTSDGQAIIGIKRITGITASGTPLLSDITNFGSLGTFPTMFAWYKPFGVDPGNPQHFIVPDIVDNVVKTSVDAGATWQTDSALTSLVTQSGALLFRSGDFTQITSFGFDEACLGHIMVGTQQAGIFQSYDSGASWAKVDGSEILPHVSAFFFHKQGQAVVSTYGRGLWTVDYDCHVIPRPPVIVDAEPLIFWKGGYIPISQIHNPDACPVCTWVLLDPGIIEDYSVQEQTNEIQEVRISGGNLKEFNWSGAEVPVTFRVSTGQELGAFGGDKQLVERLRGGKLQARGLLVEKNILKGAILASHPMTVQQIPQKSEDRTPRIEVKTSAAANPGIPVGSAPQILIHGRNFDSASSVEVLLDGRPLKLEQKTMLVNKAGEFTTSLHVPLNVGGHTILVRQKTNHGVIQDAYTFNVTVQDSKDSRKDSR
jgi:hypothetical protein